MNENNNENRRTTARRNAQNQFTSTEQRDALLRKEIENQRALQAAKTERLRALRLAKEAEEAASKPAQPTSEPRQRAKRTRRL